jgi:hypothetical protein
LIDSYLVQRSTSETGYSVTSPRVWGLAKLWKHKCTDRRKHFKYERMCRNAGDCEPSPLVGMASRICGREPSRVARRERVVYGPRGLGSELENAASQAMRKDAEGLSHDIPRNRSESC